MLRAALLLSVLLAPNAVAHNPPAVGSYSALVVVISRSVWGEIYRDVSRPIPTPDCLKRARATKTVFKGNDIVFVIYCRPAPVQGLKHG